MSKAERIKRTLDNGLYTLLPDVDLLEEFADQFQVTAKFICQVGILKHLPVSYR